MAVTIGHASIDEHGKISGGMAGDQTGREICTRQWYNKPWNVLLICKDKKLAAQAAAYMKAICDDDDFGYDQGQRTTGYLAIVKANNKVSNATPSEFDCSSLVSSCYRLAGLNIPYSLTTRNIREEFMKSGKFEVYTDSAHLSTDAYAEVGAIYLSEGHHVVMALTNGSKAGNNTTTSTTSSSTSNKSAIAYKTGNVYVLQTELRVRAGAGTSNAALTHNQLSSDAKKHDLDKDGAIDKGTRVTCEKIKTVGNDIWMKIPSGWIAAHYNGNTYVK